MSHRPAEALPEELAPFNPRKADVYVQGAAFYVACLKGGFIEEAQEFAEWFLDTFDIDLEE